MIFSDCCYTSFGELLFSFSLALFNISYIRYEYLPLDVLPSNIECGSNIAFNCLISWEKDEVNTDE